MCKALKVSRSWYYKYRCRKPSKAEQKRKCIAMYARVFHKRSRGTYGYRKVYEDFRREVTGMHFSRETLRRVMSANHMFSCVKSRHRYHCIERDKVYKYPDNILSRDFSSPEKNRKWVGDITYIWTKEGWLYLAAVMDLYSRRVIGWSMSKECLNSINKQRLFCNLSRNLSSSITSESVKVALDV